MTSITITHVDTNGEQHTRRFQDTIIYPSGGAPTPRTAEQQADEYTTARKTAGATSFIRVTEQ